MQETYRWGLLIAAALLILVLTGAAVLATSGGGTSRARTNNPHPPTGGASSTAVNRTNLPKSLRMDRTTPSKGTAGSSRSNDSNLNSGGN